MIKRIGPRALQISINISLCGNKKFLLICMFLKIDPFPLRLLSQNTFQNEILSSLPIPVNLIESRHFYCMSKHIAQLCCSTVPNSVCRSADVNS